MMKRMLSLMAAIALICVMAIPATAANDGNWTQVLSFSSVNGSGSNYFEFTDTTTITLELPSRTYCVWIDMLVSTSTTDLTSVNSIWRDSSTVLTITKVSDGLFRVYGRMSNHTYEQLELEFSCTGQAYYELLSCRVCALPADGIAVDVGVTLSTSLENHSASVAEIIEIVGSTDGSMVNDSYQAVIHVYDAVKYDTLTVYGSVNYASINSIRATYGGTVLDYSVNFIDVEAEGHFFGSDFDVSMFGKYIYAITIDLSQIDRTAENYCLVYIGGDFQRLSGMEFNCQAVSGNVEIADTSDVSWWDRFTEFMTGLFGAEDPDADDFADDMASQATEAEDLIGELEDVTKPPVEDVEVDLSGIVSDSDVTLMTSPLTAILSNNLFLSMTMISLTLALVAYVLYGKR